MSDRHIVSTLLFMMSAGLFLFAALCFGVAVATLSVWPAFCGFISAAGFAAFFREGHSERASE